MLFLFACLLFSCTSSNNLYVNDPVPLEKGDVEIQLGLGTGMEPKTSVNDSGDVAFDKQLRLAPVFQIAGNVGLGKRFILRVGLYLPYVIAGGGLNVRGQYSFFPRESKLNMATGIDIGIGGSSDEFLDVDIRDNVRTGTVLHADLFLPLAYNFSDNFRMILTPHIIYNSMEVKYHLESERYRRHRIYYPALSMGFMWEQFYLEAGASYLGQGIMPHMGIVYKGTISNEKQKNSDDQGGWE